MADFQAHINHAKKNLSILSQINFNVSDSWDWQVTCAYYVAVHLMNAHIAKSANLHYSTHERVKNALFHQMSPAKIEDSIYLDYVKLENLSRRARYLCNEESKEQVTNAFMTHDVHLKRALQRLDHIIKYISDKHKITFNIIPIDCLEIKNLNLKFFKYQQRQ